MDHLGRPLVRPSLVGQQGKIPLHARILSHRNVQPFGQSTLKKHGRRPQTSQTTEVIGNHDKRLGILNAEAKSPGIQTTMERVNITTGAIAQKFIAERKHLVRLPSRPLTTKVGAAMDVLDGLAGVRRPAR